MIRTGCTRWSIEVFENGRWREVEVFTRFAVAIRTFNELPVDSHRMLRNGEPMRIHTNTEQLDLYGESA